MYVSMYFRTMLHFIRVFKYKNENKDCNIIKTRKQIASKCYVGSYVALTDQRIKIGWSQVTEYIIIILMCSCSLCDSYIIIMQCFNHGYQSEN